MADAAVLTISDSRSQGLAEDTGGPAVVAALTAMGLVIAHRRIIPDDIEEIQTCVDSLAGSVSLIVTTGGTGIAERDVTPEAIEPLFEKQLPGFGEILRTGSFAKTPLSIISRASAGIIGRTLVILLPGSPKGISDGLALLAPAIQHVLKVLAGGKMNCQGEAGQ